MTVVERSTVGGEISIRVPSAQDAKCAETYPDFAEQIDALYEQVQSQPFILTLEDDGLSPDLGISADVRIAPELLSAVLYTNLYADTSVPYLPLVIDEMMRGKTGSFGVYFELAFSSGADLAFMMHLATVCAEDPVVSRDDIDQVDGITPFAVVSDFALADADTYISGCRIIDVDPLPDETDTNITSDLPVLILSGALDPATPNFRSEEVAATLPNSFTFVFPYGTHVQARPQSNCAVEIISQFVSDPASLPDGSCIDALSPVEFQLPPLTVGDMVGMDLTLTDYYIDEALTSLEEGQDYAIRFGPEDMTLLAGCNSVTARYASDDNSGAFSVELDGSTLVECPPDPVAEVVFDILAQVDKIIIVRQDDNSVMVLLLSDDVSLTFRSGPME